MDKQQASIQIAALKSEIDALYASIAELADKYQISVRYDGPAGYGDGGYYDDGEWVSSSAEGC